jgi:DNA-directed RNA polymerase specialized sigma24 family protein
VTASSINNMESVSGKKNDRYLAVRIITGVAAFGELQDRFRKGLELHLISHCGRSDGRSQEKAVEIASQVLADCFAKSPSLLAKWQGADNLDAFLRTVAYNRLKSWWDSRDAATEVNSDSHAITGAETRAAGSAVDWEELDAMEKALAAGVDAAVSECPEGLVFLRLKGLHGVDQRLLSAAWSHHESQTSRRIKEAMSMIRSTAVKCAADCGVELDIDTLQKALQGNPAILLGSASTALETSDAEVLRCLADGRMNGSEKVAAVALMCRNAKALEFFAQLLNRTQENQAVFSRDPALDDLMARLADHIGRTLEILRPAEVGELVSPLMADLFSDTIRSIMADGGTLWWKRPGEAVLEAVFNPFEPEITGKRQPLVSGIISLVLATSETILVDAVESHHRHSSAIDAALGKSTHSMIAVPFRVRDRVCGVLTAVRLGVADAFGERETGMLERQARAMATMLESNIVARITNVSV